MNEAQEGHCSSRANLVTEAAVSFGPSGDIGHLRGETHHRTEVRFGQKTRPSEYTTAKTITIRAREVFRRIFVRCTEDMLKSKMMHLALSDVSIKAALTTKQEFIS
ncbi:hypothetical protein TNIN_379731 [Trichonephila inaurata madagascariensis]|uniref:Uncharacterized protein n=1 Tax=Trichonephila inaurata madagascariensis TaxID=2747483 RepID=A0A8X7C1F0_9ARAC|nr:hypothetical protein TNIN_379731 [Trichonephila inaurata madagascariensis]